MLRMQSVGRLSANLTKHVPNLLGGLGRLKSDFDEVYKVKLDRDKGREEREPLSQDTFATIAWRFTPHEKNLFVDPELKVSRESFRKARNFKKDAFRALPFAAPLFFGPIGIIPAIASYGNEHWLPTAFTRRPGETYNQQMIREYANHTDHKRLKFGPHVHRLTMTLGTIQKGLPPNELIAAYRNLWFNHVDNEHMERDVTKYPEFAAYAGGDMNMHGADGRNFSHMEWYRHALEFVGEIWQFGTPLVFGPWSMNWEDYKLRLLNWYEDIKQDSYLIKRDGGSDKLSDEELLLSCLDRGLCRVEQKLSRNELRKRLEEWFYLENAQVEIPFMLAWAAGYHYDHLLNLTDFLEAQHCWEEAPTKLPASNPDLDPFLDMQVKFKLTAEQGQLLDTYREIYAKTAAQAERDTLFNALAELVAEGAPAYVAQLRPDVRQSLVAHVTTNLLQRGNAAGKAEEGDDTFTLPSTTVAELRPLIFAREDKVTPRVSNPNSYIQDKKLGDFMKSKWPQYLPMDPATTFDHPDLQLAWEAPRSTPKDTVAPTKVAI